MQTKAGKGYSPEQVFAEFEQGVRYKSGLGTHGLYEQNRINQRFYIGDQWHEVSFGGDRPLVRHNVIKRIGEYKQAVVAGAPVSVRFHADGVPNTLEIRRRVDELRGRMAKGEPVERVLSGLDTDTEIQLVMSALTDYFKTTAERVGLDRLRERALQNAYITGTGFLYTYWDDQIQTGLYADIGRRQPIKGDIACEVLDVENVYLGDPECEDIQAQPYILIAQRKRVEELRQTALRYGVPREQIEQIVPDSDGTPGWEPSSKADKATVLTRFWKVWDPSTSQYRVMAQQVCRGAVVRPAWDLGVRLYPIAQFNWERRPGCGYGESEIPYLIPNQIAINRMLTASVWAVMLMGMPIMVVNGDVVTGPITNDPGQIVQVFGSGEDVDRAIRYVSPPAFSGSFSASVHGLINNTLAQAGINSAILGDVTPENTSAIIAVREAALMPLNMVQGRYYRFCEDIARIFAEFWVCCYGNRALKIGVGDSVCYLPFQADRYANMMIGVQVEVGAASVWSEAQAIKTLDNLFERGIIDAVQYLSRLPKGLIPNANELIQQAQRALEGGA